MALTQTNNTGSTYNLALIPNISCKDLELSVWVKPISGKEDQGGGPVWRAQDPNNYYVARWNPLENNFRLYFVKDSKRTQLASADADLDPAAWHKIEITHIGDNIEAALDNKIKLIAADAAITASGTIGLWTKADAATAFDSLKLKTLSPAPESP